MKKLRVKIDDVREYREMHSPQDIRDEVSEIQKICLEAIKKVAAKQQAEQQKMQQKN